MLCAILGAQTFGRGACHRGAGSSSFSLARSSHFPPCLACYPLVGTRSGPLFFLWASSCLPAFPPPFFHKFWPSLLSEWQTFAGCFCPPFVGICGNLVDSRDIESGFRRIQFPFTLLSACRLFRSSESLIAVPSPFPFAPWKPAARCEAREPSFYLNLRSVSYGEEVGSASPTFCSLCFTPLHVCRRDFFFGLQTQGSLAPPDNPVSFECRQIARLAIVSRLFAPCGSVGRPATGSKRS